MKALWLALGLTVAAVAARAECAPDIATVTGDFGKVTFGVELADEPEERARGLMFVEQMPTLEGMLFVYDRPQRATFWMRNTLIPLDMLFIGPRGVVLNVHENAKPLDETTINGGDGVLAVLEINGGLARRLGIGAGDVLQHPAFGPDAMMPCVAESDS